MFQDLLASITVGFDQRKTERLPITSHPNGPKHPKSCPIKRMRHSLIGHSKSFQIIKELSNIWARNLSERVSLSICVNALVNEQV